MISISTKTGDKGTTGLANGERLAKNHPIFDAIGTVDELNSWLGLVVAKFETLFADHKRFLLEIQDSLFYVGAELAQSPTTAFKPEALDELEARAAELQESMSDDWHTKFLLPGGTELGAYLDIARTVCRRAERTVFGMAKEQDISPLIPKYLNRLSDYLYLLRCFVNHAVEYDEQEFVKK